MNRFKQKARGCKLPAGQNSPPSHRADRSLGAFRRKLAAFSLLEVVAAVGIFAIGMVAVIGLFAPVAKSVGNLADTEAAARVMEILTERLQGEVNFAVAHPNPSNPTPLQALINRLKISNGSGRHQLTDTDNAPGTAAADPTRDEQLLFASRDGSKIGSYGDPVWNVPVNDPNGKPFDNEKFFEIALIRNETLLPLGDATADPPVPDPILTTMTIPYTVRIRWPAFVPVPAATSARLALPTGYSPTGVVRYDNSLKQVLFFPGIVTR